ncbi:uncharacterized protein LOC122381455 [Amphibalanus amphitrite]|uniref:uncharacterized protein LOC122381455 n=1 Tax=Amphibalanus amphitrite TaxID=1232801 RepID=UPI001C907FD2|nr:uncharacterized protein LOC122381455 [Amphibalanus amphitrite]
MERSQDTIDTETFNSQDFIEYLNEYRFVSLDGAEDPTDEENPPEDGEEEAEWLRQAGFGSLLTALEPTSESGDTEWEGFVTLSHRQAAVVKRRLHVLRDTAQKRRGQRSRRPDMRRLFPSEGSGSTGSRSRSATPDSLDPLSPPLTPPDTAGRLQAGSPNSQGYHSSSRGSLDRLEGAGEEEERVTGVPEFRHVLRIPLDSEPRDLRSEPSEKSLDHRPRSPDKSRDHRSEPPEKSRDRHRASSNSSRDRGRREAARSRDRRPEPVRRLRSARDQPDRSRRPPITLFETSGRYDLSRQESSPSDSSGIETVSFQSVGSVRRPRRPVAPAPVRPAEVPAVRHPVVSRRASTPAAPTSAAPAAPAVRPAVSRTATLSLEERLGRTRLCDLSESDVVRVQKLALLELTGLFDEHGLSYSRRKARRRRLGARSSAEGAVFGASLGSLLKRDLQRLARAQPVPLVFETILTHLERHGVREEGLLRVPGHRGKTEQLRQLIDDQFYSHLAAVEAALRASSANDAAALLKQLLRQLPAPLLTDESVDAFYRSDALPAGPDQLQALSLLCLRLPPANRALLRRLLDFLAAIAAQERTNKMSLENVAMIMAPNLIPPARRRQKDITAEIQFAAVTSRVVRRLVQQREQLWLVPPQFVRQVRHQHEEELYERARRDSAGPMKKLLRRRDTAIVRKIDNEVDFQEGVLRVSADQFGRPSWPIRLEADTTAGDLVASCLREVALPDTSCRVRQERRRHSTAPSPEVGTVCSLRRRVDLATALQTHFLHEHGGNIGERRLEHCAVLLDCYQENPNARWVVHCCHDLEAPADPRTAGPPQTPSN